MRSNYIRSVKETLRLHIRRKLIWDSFRIVGKPGVIVQVLLKARGIVARGLGGWPARILAVFGRVRIALPTFRVNPAIRSINTCRFTIL